MTLMIPFKNEIMSNDKINTFVIIFLQTELLTKQNMKNK